MSDAFRARMLGKPKSPEHIAKVIASKKGKPRPKLSAEHKAAIGNAHRGKVYSAETRAKISASRLKLFASLKTTLRPRKDIRNEGRTGESIRPTRRR